jgi:hypothetical protein
MEGTSSAHMFHKKEPQERKTMKENAKYETQL